jgi:hypothetical protein
VDCLWLVIALEINSKSLKILIIKNSKYITLVSHFLIKTTILQPSTILQLTPIILATQEAEIRRIKVQTQPGQITHEPLSWKYLTQKGLVGSRCSPWVQAPVPPKQTNKQTNNFTKQVFNLFYIFANLFTIWHNRKQMDSHICFYIQFTAIH